jgi:outer membrane immunogenic protein
MFKFVCFSFIALGAAGTAVAQDSDAVSWSGPYAGLHAGYGFDDGRTLDVAGTSTATGNAIASGARPGRFNANRSGFVGGGQIGWNLQRGRWIFGPEGDFSYMRSRGTANVGTLATAGAPQSTVVQTRLDWLGSARLRAGYALGNGMIYGTGGYAIGKVKGAASFYAPNGTLNYAGGNSYTAQGWTAGGGLEFRPFHQGAMSKVSLGFEATYYDLGRSHITAGAANALTAGTGSYVVGRDTRGYNGVFKVNYAF